MAGHSVPVASAADHRRSDPIEREAADLRIGLEVEARRRERWIRERLREDATLDGALAAAAGRDVGLHLVTGDRVAGRLVGVGSDVVEVRRRQRSTWLSIDAITALEAPEELPAAGPGADGRSMIEVLHDLADDRSEVAFGLDGGTTVLGMLTSIGEVATLRTGPDRRTTYVAVPSIVSVTLAG